MIINDPDLFRLLALSGWSPDREVNIGHWIDEFNSKGFVMNEVCKEVLKSFGGLTIVPIELETQAYCPTRVFFDPFRLRHMTRLVPWEHYLQVTLSPVGECWQGACLFAGSDGAFYVNGDCFLMERLGNTVEEGLSILLLAKARGTRLHLPPK